MNITNYDGPLVLPYLPHRNTFIVSSSLMQMLPVRGLFAGLSSKDPHSHIAKLMYVCKSCLVWARIVYECHWVVTVSFISDIRCRDIVCVATLQLILYLRSVEICVLSKLLSSVQEDQPQG